LIHSFAAPRQFVDLQSKGPYRRWQHTHSFEECDAGTWVIDDIEYELPWGLIGRLAQHWFVRRSLARIFDHRQQRIIELLGVVPNEGAVPNMQSARVLD
jgi:ligand-binding SRPBCC domain-containing protein